MMRTLTLFLFMLIVSILPLIGQNLTPSSYKFQVTSDVVRQVSLAFSDLRQAPKLVMPRGKSNQIARFTSEPEMQLIVDEKLYDLCREMGKDSISALAFVLSHELTHFFYSHRHPFGFALPQNQMTERGKELEKEADLYGLINAFAAGFQTFTVASPILEKIYRSYQLPDSLAGYPTKQERLQSIALHTTQARTLASTFEVGTFLYLKGEYAAAEHCFSNLCSQIPAKEFLNNLGLCQLQQALNSGWAEARKMPFKLPAELDSDNRLIDGSRQIDVKGNSNSEALVQSAVRNFEKAISIDKFYMAAYVNLATSWLLLGKTGTVKETISQLEKASIKLIPDLHLLKGVALAQNKEFALGKIEMNLANGAYEIEFNRKVFDLLTSGISEAEVSDQIQKLILKTSGSERVIRVKAENVMNNISLPLAEKIPIDHQEFLPKPDLVHYQYGQVAGLNTFKILLKDGTFHVVQGNSRQVNLVTAKGIMAGDPVAKLAVQYGTPSRVVPLSNGRFYCYDKAGIYFKTQNDRVESWLIYQKIITSD